MPTYLYQCNCGHSEEVFHEMSAIVVIVCPTCLTDMARKPQVATVQFKGKGWGKDA